MYLSEKVDESIELVSVRREEREEEEEGGSMEEREERAEARRGESQEERREKREGSALCWYSSPGSLLYGFDTWQHKVKWSKKSFD